MTSSSSCYSCSGLPPSPSSVSIHHLPFLSTPSSLFTLPLSRSLSPSRLGFSTTLAPPLLPPPPLLPLHRLCLVLDSQLQRPSIHPTTSQQTCSTPPSLPTSPLPLVSVSLSFFPFLQFTFPLKIVTFFLSHYESSLFRALPAACSYRIDTNDSPSGMA
ncbi:hypothetical protein BO86DRAFT_145934 [Aspergillus japonicus CBS 114.51]|uniref:Uncharacterized protein n=1 Tax=Aspergillus japonicus CBS 114.51 TaxID=1448312 RepID=A0A8T8WVL3_ASPJA|nr:hypothetical protein BO86DRAFT_145934 [Aspergillus japonicus CBS 114.51]RAH79876.1 hypothetical protein BO86DRAFT_145934 [Aspergillus japonicus CBS 114.51]